MGAPKGHKNYNTKNPITKENAEEMRLASRVSYEANKPERVIDGRIRRNLEGVLAKELSEGEEVKTTAYWLVKHAVDAMLSGLKSGTVLPTEASKLLLDLSKLLGEDKEQVDVNVNVNHVRLNYEFNNGEGDNG